MPTELDALRQAYAHVVAGTVVIDSGGKILLLNEAAQRIFGYSEDEVLARNVSVLMPEPFKSQHDEYLSRYVAGGDPQIIGRGREVRGRRKDGTTFEMHLGVGESYADGQRVFVASITDMEVRRALEARVAQSQRLEAVGQLTGGVAHDFNNLLLVLDWHAEMLEEVVSEGLGDHDGARESIDAIKNAIRQAASLTSQLLAFSGRQTLAPRPTAVCEAVVELRSMVRRTFPESIALDVVRQSEERCWANLDAALFETAILNLLLNSRDALPSGGAITVEVGLVELGRGVLPRAPEAEGRFVRVRVSDTGTGIAPDHLERIFEPFFTTRSRAGGSGLGLSMVYGFVRQSGGHVHVESRVNEGTVVELLLPSVPEPVEHAGSAEVSRSPSDGRGRRVLLVEDESSIRRAVKARLERHGWVVAEASSVDQAEAVLGADSFDVLITDVVLEGSRDGIELARAVRRRYPQWRVIVTTGYSDVSLPNDLADFGSLDLLRKPYRLSDLIRLLDGGGRSPGSTAGSR